jgi:hypothetical protein
MRARVLRPAFVGLALMALVAACSTSGATQAPAASEEPDGGGSIAATGAWARATPPGTTTSAVYVTLTNGTGTDDALVAVATPVTPTAEIHEVSTVSAAPMESAGMGGGGMMGMHPIEKLPLPAGGMVELKPGGYHIMLIGLTEPLKDGTTIDVTLTFEKAPPITLTVPVKMG